MWETLFNMLQTEGLKLITLSGNINPFLGLGVAILVGIALIYVGIKLKKDVWDKLIANSGETIGTTTGDNQGTTGTVLEGTDDWLNGKKDK